MIQPETGHTNEKGRNTMKMSEMWQWTAGKQKSTGYFLCDSCKKKFSQETLNRFQNKKQHQKERDSSVNSGRRRSEDEPFWSRPTPIFHRKRSEMNVKKK